MKRILLTNLAILALGTLALSCVDKDYDTGKISKETDTSILVDDKQEEVAGKSIIAVKGTKSDSNGNLTVYGTKYANEVKQACTVSQLSSGTPVTIKMADMIIELPLASKFPLDDVYDAIVQQYIKVGVNNDKGIAFKFTANLINKNGKSFPVEASIPAKVGNYTIYVSESGKTAPVEDYSVDAKAISNFKEIFTGAPKSVTLKDIVLTGITSKVVVGQNSEETLDFTFSVEGIFPMEFKKGVEFTLRDTVGLKDVDLSEYEGVKRIKAYFDIRYNLPFKMVPTLVSPEEIVASCAGVEGSKIYPEYVTEKDVVISGECPTGAKKHYDNAIVDLKMSYMGEGDSIMFNDKMSFQITVTKYTVTHEL